MLETDMAVSWNRYEALHDQLVSSPIRGDAKRMQERKDQG